MIELSPFFLTSDRCWGVWYMDLIAAGLFACRRNVDELEDERSSCYYATSSWQEIFPDNVLEY
jgi:hypothetical protein